MAEKMNINELLNEAKKNGFELTEDQLDGIAGGESVDYEALGLMAKGFAGLADALNAMKNAKDAGMTLEEFIVANGSEPTPELIQAIGHFWELMDRL